MHTVAAYGAFLSQFNWRYFITCRSPYNIKTSTVERWCDRLFIAHMTVNRIFWVSERDKGDMHNKHVHMLIETNENLSYKEIRTGLGEIAVGNYQEIYSVPEVCKYVTKFITHQGIEYNLVEAKS